MEKTTTTTAVYKINQKSEIFSKQDLLGSGTCRYL